MSKPKMMTDFTRQIDLLDPKSFNETINIIGCGATGSWVALQFAKLGLKDVHLYDFDIVEEHNLANQFFGLSDLGSKKCEALRDRIKELTGYEYTAHDEKVDGTAGLTGYVLILTDTMASRKDIFFNAVEYNPNVKMCVETRMGLTGGNVYAVNPNDYTQLTEYKKTLNYGDDTAAKSTCGISQSVGISAIMIANHAVWRVIADFLEEYYPNSTQVSGPSAFVQTDDWA